LNIRIKKYKWQNEMTVIEIPFNELLMDVLTIVSERHWAKNKLEYSMIIRWKECSVSNGSLNKK
jgi:hypothetical protein